MGPTPGFKYVWGGNDQFCSDDHQNWWAGPPRVLFQIVVYLLCDIEYFDVKCWIYHPSPVWTNPHLFKKMSDFWKEVVFWSVQTQHSVETLFLSERANTQLFRTPKIFGIDALFVMLEGFLYWSQVLESSHAYLKHTCMHMSYVSVNIKILLTSWIMHRFQRFLVFWKAECLLFHLETTFPHSFVLLFPTICVF